MARAGWGLAAALLLARQAEAAPIITSESAGVNVSGMTPRGRAFVFGVLWEADGETGDVVLILDPERLLFSSRTLVR